MEPEPVSVIKQPQRMKRLTVDIPENLHRKVKAICALKGVKVAEEIRRLLTEHFEGSHADRP